RDLPRALSVKAGLGIRRLFVSMEPLMESVDLSRWLRGVDLVIVGGESGSLARPMHTDWVRAVRDLCADVGVPFHFKQWGEFCPSGGAAVDVGRLSAEERALACDGSWTAARDLSDPDVMNRV